MNTCQECGVQDETVSDFVNTSNTEQHYYMCDGCYFCGAPFPEIDEERYVENA